MDSRNKRSDKNSELYRAITALDSLDDCYDFLVDLCTQPELKAMEQRYEVARMLDRGMIYSDILAETSASSATISRVNRCLTGGTGGYERAFAKVDAEEKKLTPKQGSPMKRSRARMTG